MCAASGLSTFVGGCRPTYSHVSTCQITRLPSPRRLTVRSHIRTSTHPPKPTPPRTLTLTLEYCKRFANVKNLEDEGASQYLTSLRQ